MSETKSSKGRQVAVPSRRCAKINMNDSSQGDPNPASIGGIDRDSSRLVMFFFTFHEGMQTIKLMKGLDILQAFEKEHEMGWRRIICESNSHVLIDFLIRGKVEGVSW